MRRPLTVLIPLVILALSLPAAAPVAARRPVALGIASGSSTDMAAVDAFATFGAKPALWSLWSTWGDRGGEERCTRRHGTCAFPADAVRELLGRGITPLILWQPTDPTKPSAGRYERYRNIIVGKHDRYIRAWAKTARSMPGPVILRFAHEMNGTWFPWSLTAFDNTTTRYQQAWRHVVTVFRHVGARNVRFLWSPFQRCSTCSPYPYERFYPGNAFVDYVGVTALNWGAPTWTSLEGLLVEPLAMLRRVSRTSSNQSGKPVILPEIGSNDVGGDKAAWIRDGYPTAARRWRAIRAMVYFDYDTTFAGQPDWRLTVPDRSALKAYRRIASKPAFGGSLR